MLYFDDNDDFRVIFFTYNQNITISNAGFSI